MIHENEKDQVDMEREAHDAPLEESSQIAAKRAPRIVGDVILQAIQSRNWMDDNDNLGPFLAGIAISAFVLLIAAVSA